MFVTLLKKRALVMSYVQKNDQFCRFIFIEKLETKNK